MQASAAAAKLNQATKNHIANLERIIRSTRSTAVDRTAAEQALTILKAELGIEEAKPPASTGTGEFIDDYEAVLAAGPYVGIQYLDLFGFPDDPRTWTPIYRYVIRRGGYYAARGEICGALL